MKISKNTIKEMIREELMMIESQVKIGLPHKFTNQELIDFVEDYIASERNEEDPEEIAKATLLMKILTSRYFTAANRKKEFRYDKQKNVLPPTTDAEFEEMKKERNKLYDLRRKLARNSIQRSGVNPMSGGNQYFSTWLRQADPTGELQRSGKRPDEISDVYRASLYRNDLSNPFYKPEFDDYLKDIPDRDEDK